MYIAYNSAWHMVNVKKEQAFIKLMHAGSLDGIKERLED